VQQRGRDHGKGNPRAFCVADPMVDARPQTGIAPDDKRRCGIQPAHQSLFTDVFRSRPLLCTIQLQSNFALPRAEKGEAARGVLDFEHQS
jgi:hypothetical protein